MSAQRRGPFVWSHKSTAWWSTDGRRGEPPTERIRYVGRVTSGERLRNLRKRAGLTQVELAQRAGVVPTVLSAYERGRREPGADTFLRPVAAAGFEPTWTPRLDPVVQGRRLADVLDLAEALPFRARPMPRAKLRSA